MWLYLWQCVPENILKIRLIGAFGCSNRVLRGTNLKEDDSRS